jgi:hypothetical protein
MSLKTLSRCATCRHAEWKKTANGRRHPEGSGKCAFQFAETPVPKWLNLKRWGAVDQPTTLREAIESSSPARWIYYTEHAAHATPCATWESAK